MSTEICGITFPITMHKTAFACCLKAPKHRGDHACRVYYTWPKDIVIKDGGILFTAKFLAPKGVQPAINAALERDSMLREGDLS